MKKIVFVFFIMFHVSLWAAGSRDYVASQIASLEHQVAPKSPNAEYGFFKTHQLIFFFASTCSHCHNAAPHLKAWASAQGIEVQAISFDNKSLPEFQTTIAAHKEIVAAAFQDRTIEYPALFVMNSKTLALYPAVIGEFTVQELDTRMQTLIPKIIAFERGHR